MGQIKITLLSDSCISSGETYNSSIDSDVCYDSYGLPFIPAKRLRGCLREAGLELQDFGEDFGADKFGKKIDVVTLFGKEGNSPAVFEMGNAKLEKYEEYVKQLKNCPKLEYKHQQTVLNQFTYIRYQTKINRASGAAEDTSLRAIRVMKKGLEFLADVNISKEYEKALGLCCKNLRSMGMNRTRGMGEVRVEYVKDDRKRSKPDHEKWTEGADYNRMDYQISLKSPMLIKSVAGGQTKTIPYIDGSKILGMLAQNLKKEELQNPDKEDQAGKPEGDAFGDLQNSGKLICSNAYISDGKVRYTPVPASLYGIKNEKEEARDRSVKTAEDEGSTERKQLVQLDGIYVREDMAGEIDYMTVDTEIRYHHSRPQDKSKGHAIANSGDEGSFYQMESIAEGQTFSGYILGTKEQIEKIYKIITQKPIQRLGYGKTSEYGEAEFTVTKLETRGDTKQEENKMNEFIVKLNAPAVLYNENGMYEAKEELLAEYIAEGIKERNGLEESPALTIENRFLKYCVVGGFNTTWGLHKPIINAFDAGTTLVMKVKEDQKVDIGRMKNVFLGERISEGYGEVSFYPCSSVYKKLLKLSEHADWTQESRDIGKNADTQDLLRDIASKCAYDYIKKKARDQIGKWTKKDIQKSGNIKAVIANLLMMCRQQDTYEKFMDNIEKRFNKKTDEKNAKLETARKIISGEALIKMVREEAEEKYPEADLEDNRIYKTYVTALLVALKYKAREENK